MSWTLYDTLREYLYQMSESTDKQQANELLVDTLCDMADMLSVYLPNIDTLSDSIVAEWRKKQ